MCGNHRSIFWVSFCRSYPCKVGFLYLRQISLRPATESQEFSCLHIPRIGIIYAQHIFSCGYWRPNTDPYACIVSIYQKKAVSWVRNINLKSCWHLFLLCAHGSQKTIERVGSLFYYVMWVPGSNFDVSFYDKVWHPTLRCITVNCDEIM